MADTPSDEPSTMHHPYHLVEPSPWPLLAALAAGCLAVGGLLLMHGDMLLPFLGALLLVLAVMALWWRDVIREAVVEKAHSVVTRIGFRYGMAMFILRSEEHTSELQSLMRILYAVF